MHARGRRPGVAAAPIVAVLLAAVLLAACVEKTEVVETPSATTAAPTQAGSATDGPSVVSQFPGADTSVGRFPDAPVAAGEADPIVVGMINQENTPIGSFPELRLAAQAAVDFVNAELGGVDGRPIRFEPCITTFSVEKSQACAQRLVQAGAVAVTNGIDISSNGSIPVLEQNQVPMIGGVPVNADEMKSPISFQFSGGSPGAMVAFADYAATTQHAGKVAVIYGDYASIKLAAVDYGVAELRRLGVPDVTEVPYPVTSTDFLPVLTKANEGHPDAIVLVAADTACAPAMKTAHDLGITATMYLVGSCAAPSVADEVGEDAVAGRIFNVEGPVTGADVDTRVYAAALAKYGDPQLPLASAGTVSFRNIMNLWALMKEVGGPDVSSRTLLAAVHGAHDHPSFGGHPYTCDGRQVPDLPSLCAPQQILVVHEDGGLRQLTDWIDVPSLLAS